MKRSFEGKEYLWREELDIYHRQQTLTRKTPKFIPSQFRVIVETLAILSAQHLLFDQIVQEFGWGNEFVTLETLSVCVPEFSVIKTRWQTFIILRSIFYLPSISNKLCRIQSNVVSQLKRSHRIASPQLHCDINIFLCRITLNKV